MSTDLIYYQGYNPVIIPILYRALMESLPPKESHLIVVLYYMGKTCGFGGRGEGLAAGEAHCHREGGNASP